MIDKVREWVTGQGYPLEMRTAKAFRAGQFEVHQSEIYFDEEAGKTREIDLIAVAPDIVGLTRINFAVECKSSKKPWVIFSSNQATAGMNIFYSYAVMSQTACEALMDIARSDPNNLKNPFDFALFQRLKWLRKDKYIGYTFRQAFSETDNAYTALVSAMRAACHPINKADERKVPHFQIVFPVIVIDSPLVHCYLDENNEMQLEQVDSGEVIFTAPDQERITTCIRIVTADWLPQFVTEAAKEVEQIRLELLPKERAIWHDLFGIDYPA
jgi:hypothetical protein